MLVSILFVALFASLTVASPVGDSASPARSCGSSPSPEELSKFEADFAAKKASFKESDVAVSPIRVWVHVISKDTTVSGGNIPSSQISSQISVLNTDYAGSGISWTLVGTSRTVNTTWYNIPSSNGKAQTEMKRALRKGGPETLNVYAVGSITSGSQDLLGYATFPYSYTDAPIDDGCVLLSSSFPGGTHAPFNLGRTLTHEAGHWVGLYHTFQGGCTGSGDLVSDTPPEAQPVFGCPASSDTCPGDNLPDDFHNYMDYTNDNCMTHFSTGQGTRLRAQIATYRGIR